jgi:hypothetical protein
MPRLGFRLLALCALALALAACNHNQSSVTPPPNTTPENALRADLVLTRNGDFDGLLRSTLPPADYQAWRGEWQRARAQQPAPTPEQSAHFAQMMQKLTAPGAEDALFKQLQPQLEQLRTHRAQNLPMLLGILQAAGSDLVQSAGLSPDQKTQATQAIATLAAWAQSADFSDEARAKQAIDVICATARKLDIHTVDQWRALDYLHVMARYTTGWSGLKQLLKIYGLDLDATFDNARLETLSDDGTQARVRETLVLAGKPIVSEAHLVQQDGHWYDADRLAAWRKRHQKPAPASSAAHATSAPASASSASAH